MPDVSRPFSRCHCHCCRPVSTPPTPTAPAEPDIVPAVLAPLAAAARPDGLAAAARAGRGGGAGASGPADRRAAAHAAAAVRRRHRPYPGGAAARAARFGEAAVALDLASPIRPMCCRALSMQFNYPCAGPEPLRRRRAGGGHRSARCVQARPFASCAAASWPALIGDLPLAVLSPDWATAAPMSRPIWPSPSASSGERTVLVDGNLRTPALHRVFGLEATERAACRDLLNGRRARPALRPLRASCRGCSSCRWARRPIRSSCCSRCSRCCCASCSASSTASSSTPMPARDSADARVIAATCGQVVLVGRNGRPMPAR